MNYSQYMKKYNNCESSKNRVPSELINIYSSRDPIFKKCVDAGGCVTTCGSGCDPRSAYLDPKDIFRVILGRSCTANCQTKCYSPP